mmetsp:Transcript_23831/g.57467  ORF Transcript_23831/g.57467 Transcript_23831/m.57467 type:complete len:101 (-) Transcript_23831:200-502(-)
MASCGTEGGAWSLGASSGDDEQSCSLPSVLWLPFIVSIYYVVCDDGSDECMMNRVFPTRCPEPVFYSCWPRFLSPGKRARRDDEILFWFEDDMRRHSIMG